MHLGGAVLSANVDSKAPTPMGDGLRPTRSTTVATGDRWPVIYRAAAVLPYPDRERATAGLRQQLRLLAIAGGGNLEWTTLTVKGPAETPGPQDATWFEWTATVTVVGGRDLPREPDLPAALSVREPVEDRATQPLLMAG
jgi:hypothetical protein